MRRRLVISTIAIVLVVLGTLAVPIGLIIHDATERQIDGYLDDQTNTIAAILSDDEATGRAPSLGLIRDLLGPNDGARIVDPDGLVLLEVDTAANSVRETTLLSSDGVLVTVSTSSASLDEDFRARLRVLLILALGGVVAAAGLAAVQAHQLARPLERLSRRAAGIGQGDFSLGSFRRTRIPEIDDIGSALETSAQRVDTMLANERHFTADATHQLRTGITGMAMRVEILTMHDDQTVAAEAREILVQTDQLNSTIDELLAAARNRSASERAVFDLRTLVDDHVDDWLPRFDRERRHLHAIVSSPPPPVYGTKGLAGQVIDILIDNALQHGEGAVTLMIDGPAVTVIDQGPGVPSERLRSLFEGPVDPSARHGRGLSLARRLAQVDGAALEVVGNAPLRICYRLPLGLGESLTSEV